jgi:hypothetical protein
MKLFTMDEEKNLNEPLSEYSKPLTFDKIWLMFQETDKKFQEIDRKIDKLAKLYGGVSENSKDFAEEFFRRGLESQNELFGIEFSEIAYLEKKTKKLQGEYDIVLYNGDTMIVIEVKHKLHPRDVEIFLDRKLPNFKKLFPEYAKKAIIGGVAGMSVPNDSAGLAQDNGLLVLTQAGDNIFILNDKGFEPKHY